jgi:thymidylate synthase (FAD)
MRIIEPSVEVEYVDGEHIARRIERLGRVCYKSESKIGPDTYKDFIRGLIKRGHESVLEHDNITAKIVCDRGVTHEIVRHRIASYSQESTRYCRYGDEITVIRPFMFQEGSHAYGLWAEACLAAETAYLHLLSHGATPQEARNVLPNSLKTELVISANIREWRHILKLRCAPQAHPQMQQIMIPLLWHLRYHIPALFDDIWFGTDMQNANLAKVSWVSWVECKDNAD